MLKLKSLLLTLVAIFAFSAFSSAQTQLHIETSIGPCSYQVQILIGPANGTCTITNSIFVTAVNGDNFYMIPAGMEVKGIEVADAGGGTNHASVAPVCGMAGPDDVGDCFPGPGTDNVYYGGPLYYMIY